MPSQAQHGSCWHIGFVTIFLILPALVFTIPDYSGLPPGPYCGKLRQCCDQRVDSCSVPIEGTLCYCDEFCDKSSEDCCPDFWSFCKNETSEPILQACNLNGRDYYINQVTTLNCNECKCTHTSAEPAMICERDACLVDEQLIETVNYEKRKLGWHAQKYEQFWGKKLKDGLIYKLGTLKPNRFIAQMTPVRRIYDPTHLPPFFDAEKKWPNMMSHIQDQGWCGSSWAVSTAAVASDRLAIMSLGREKVALSAQHLLACDNRGQQSCKGGYLDRAWQYFKHFGVVDEKCYPYQGIQTKCTFPKKGNLLSVGCSPATPNRKEYYRTGPAYRLGSVDDIMYEIMQSGPVQATLKVHQDFFSYRGGIYKRSTASRSSLAGYHSVRIVGWGTDNNSYPPQKYWKVANSWGTNWGERGYFRIARGTNECELEMYVLGVWARASDRK